MEKKYYNINKKYLAMSLSYLGFRYYAFGEGKEIVYSFEDTYKFREAYTSLIELKKKFNN